jgi:hypothetical protein
MSPCGRIGLWEATIDDKGGAMHRHPGSSISAEMQSTCPTLPLYSLHQGKKVKRGLYKGARCKVNCLDESFSIYIGRRTKVDVRLYIAWRVNLHLPMH